MSEIVIDMRQIYEGDQAKIKDIPDYIKKALELAGEEMK